MDPDSGLPSRIGKTKIEGGRLKNVTSAADSQCTGCGEISDWRSVGEVEKGGEEGRERDLSREQRGRPHNREELRVHTT